MRTTPRQPTLRPGTLTALLAAAALLTSCAAPIGRAPALRGTYWQNAQVTNPDGNGPQVIRWGPPPNYNPDANPN